jgi:vacuolar-type H+-ATPase subunit I/STV1
VNNDLWFKIPIAILLGFMIWRMIPTAIDWIKNGPKGSSKEWLNVSMLIGAVVLFVAFLVTTVQN